ncbi:MAG TPA: T9SS type A sorting domain-containing protein, partial [Ignavibacteriaceae bacterium]|nr:T9SS type A sorting domain-containing protein [Ignavibacteriaceae bacterium]
GINVIFNSVYFIDSLIGWTANLGRRPHKSTDGGDNWIEQINLNIWESREIYFRDSLNGFIINGILDLLRSTNSGTNWFIQLNSQYVIRTFGWLSASHGFIIGDGVYETNDSGDSWSEILELRNVGLRKLNSPKNYIGYSTGNLGLIYQYIDTSIVPVELISFSGFYENEKIILLWTTASELNNNGFEIQKSVDEENWQPISFVEGKGTSSEYNSYDFEDTYVSNEKNYYRLKQIDFDGTYTYSDIITVYSMDLPLTFELFQNYPNPFNPTTTIKYDLPKSGNVELVIYDILGRKVKSLVNETKEAGRYEVKWDASNSASGVYIYQLRTENFIDTKKMILIR